jgi:hypothetical protein
VDTDICDEEEGDTMSAPTMDLEAILHLVQQWPARDQIALVNAILSEIRRSSSADIPELPPLLRLRGIAATGRPAPTDDEIARILEEERMHKYGR